MASFLDNLKTVDKKLTDVKTALTPSLRDASSKLGYSVGYNPNNNNVSVTDPTSKKTLNFTSGNGSNYGIGFNNGQHFIQDAEKFKGYFAPTYTKEQNDIIAMGESQKAPQNTPISTPVSNSVTPQKPAQLSPSTVATPTLYDPTNDVNALKEAQRNSLVATLEAKRNAVLGNLKAEQDKIKSDYELKRGEASTGSQLGAKNFAEFMASRGQNNAVGMNGTNAQAEISRNVALQGAISGLNRDEVQANIDAQRRATEALNQYQTDLASGYSNIDAQASQQLINARQQADTTNYNRMRDTVMDNRYVDTTNYARGRDYQTDLLNAQNRNDTLLNQLGLTYNPTTGQYQRNTQGMLADAQIQGLNIENQYKPKMYDSTLATQDLQRQGMTIDNQFKPLNYQSDLDTQALQRQGLGEDIYTKKLQNQYLPKQLEQNQTLQALDITSKQLGIDKGTLELQYLPKMLETQLKGDELKNTSMEIANQLAQFDLSYLKPTELEKLKVDLEGGRLQNAAQTIQNSFMPQKMQAEIGLIFANTYQSRASGEAALMNANTNQMEAVNNNNYRNAQLGLEREKFAYAKANSGTGGSRSSGGSGGSGSSSQQLNSLKFQSAQDEKLFDNINTTIGKFYTTPSDGTTPPKVDKYGVYNMLSRLEQNGASPSVLKSISGFYDITPPVKQKQVPFDQQLKNMFK